MIIRKVAMAGNTKVRDISLPPELDKRLVERAQLEDRPVSTIVRRALEFYFRNSSLLVPDMSIADDSIANGDGDHV